MAKKFNNRNLSVLLLGVLCLALVAWWFGGRKNTFSSTGVKLDSAAISTIYFYPEVEKGKEIKLVKQGVYWTVTDGKITEPVDSMKMLQIITKLMEVKADRLVGKNKDKWNEYKVSDSSSTRIKVMQGEMVALDIHLGKVDFSQGRGGNGGQFGGGGNIEMTSYYRNHNTDEVYAMKDAALSFLLNTPFSGWRNQKFIDASGSRINKLTYSFPGEEKFALEKTDGKWKVGKALADTSEIKGLIAVLSHRSITKFYENGIPQGPPQYQLNIDGQEMETISVSAWKNNPNEFVMNSSQNPKAYFVSDSTGDFSLIFREKGKF